VETGRASEGERAWAHREAGSGGSCDAAAGSREGVAGGRRARGAAQVGEFDLERAAETGLESTRRACKFLLFYS